VSRDVSSSSSPCAVSCPRDATRAVVCRRGCVPACSDDEADNGNDGNARWLAAMAWARRIQGSSRTRR
jgi:hypothetical protein